MSILCQDCKQFDCECYYDCCPHNKVARIDRNRIYCNSYRSVYDVERNIKENRNIEYK